MNTTKGSPHGTNKSITGIDPKVKLSLRKIAVITGVIFIIATGALFPAAALTPGLTGTDYLTQFSAHPNQVAAGALAYLVAASARAGLAIAMHLVTLASTAGVPVGSVVFTALSAVFYMVEVVILLSLLTLGQQFTTTGAADRTLLQAIGNSLVSVREHAALVAVLRTIYENPNGKQFLGEIQQSERVVSYPDRDKYHYDLDTLRCAAQGTGLTMSYNGDWGHPDNQKVVVFSRATDG